MPDLVMTAVHLPSWATDLNPRQRAELVADLAADEMCACEHRDDQHDVDSTCTVCTVVPCHAYRPVQR